METFSNKAVCVQVHFGELRSEIFPVESLEFQKASCFLVVEEWAVCISANTVGFLFFFLSVLFVCRFTTQLVNLLANLSILWQQARFQIHLDAQIHKMSVKCLTWQPNPHTLLLLVGERQQQAGMPAYLWVFAGPNTRSCPQI